MGQEAFDAMKAELARKAEEERLKREEERKKRTTQYVMIKDTDEAKREYYGELKKRFGD